MFVLFGVVTLSLFAKLPARGDSEFERRDFGGDESSELEEKFGLFLFCFLLTAFGVFSSLIIAVITFSLVSTLAFAELLSVRDIFNSENNFLHFLAGNL